MSGKGSGRRPTQIDSATFADNWERIFSGHGVTVSTCGSNPPSLCSNQSAPAIYVDDATGTQVSEDWWPGDAHDQ